MHPQYTKQELAHRNGKVLTEIWVAYKGHIYDVTSSELFKDGEHYFHSSGQDLTEEMEAAPHFDDVLNNFPIVGILLDK